MQPETKTTMAAAAPDFGALEDDERNKVRSLLESASHALEKCRMAMLSFSSISSSFSVCLRLQIGVRGTRRAL